MRTLRDILLAAAEAIDTVEGQNCIRVWRFIDAPEELQALSENSGDEDWLAVVPDAIAENYYIPWLMQPGFGYAGVDQYPIAGAMVYIGCHA